MFKFELIEYLLVGVVIMLQVAAFIKTWRRINIYRDVIPPDYRLSSEDTPLLSYTGMESDANQYRLKLVEHINGYLLRNRESAPDFNLIKDIAERNTDVLEEDISQTTSVPLYLGLMGTMIGVVLGLWNMNNISASINISNAGSAMGDGINVLLGGVKIAMIASFIGIMFTVINSSFRFNTSRRKVENEKNGLYTFIQTQLLPVFSKDVTVVMQTMQNNMLLFSQNFDNNLHRLEKMLNKNHDALLAQESILTALENTDITSFVKGNVKVLQELRQGTEQLQKFNQYLDKLTEFTGSAERFSVSMEAMVGRTDNIEDVLHNIDYHFSMSKDLLLFLRSHFEQIQERGSLIQQSLIKVDTVLDDSFNELKEHIQAKITAIKELTIAETSQLSRVFEENRSGLEKLNLLEDISSGIKSINNNNEKNNGRLFDTVDSLYTVTSEHLPVINTNTKRKTLVQKIKQLFKKQVAEETNA